MMPWTPRMHFRRAAMAVFLTIPLASACGHSATSSTLFPEGPLSVAVKEDQPGFSSGAINPKGFDISVAKFIAKSLGYGEKVNFPLISSPGRDSVIPNGTADLVIATYSITPQRDEKEDFAGPYLQTTQALLVREKDHRFDKPDPSGKRQWSAGLLGCTAGGSTPDQERILPREGLPGGPKMLTPDNYSTCVNKLRNHKVDFVFTDTLILYGYEQEHDDVKVVEAGDVGANQYYGVALRRGLRDTCEKIKRAILDYINSDDWIADFRNNFLNVTKVYRSTGVDQSNWQSLFSVNEGLVTQKSYCK